MREIVSVRESEALREVVPGTLVLELLVQDQTLQLISQISFIENIPPAHHLSFNIQLTTINFF